MAIDDLRKNKMMSHLLNALDRGEDIGHYGRLVFAMVARHFIGEDEICNYLLGNVTEEEARALCKQVEMHDYNPPRPQRILEWQAQQAFPICPDRDACNVYRDLKFPDSVYEHIEEFYEQKS
jgi:hypothetical protein